MLPGQNVNKDVYAVNTGTIEAFVKENVTGVLNYTYESKVNTWDADCVELTLEQAAAIEGATTQDGFKTMEAGGYLAWTNAGAKAASDSYSVGTDSATVENVTLDATLDGTNNPKTFTAKVTVGSDVFYAENSDDGATLYTVDGSNVYSDASKTLKKSTSAAVDAPTPGPLYSGRTQDITDPWYPTTEGVYIFRRSIKHDMTQNNNHPADDAFTYAGYYYDGNGKYYKIVLGSDDFRFNNGTTYQFDVAAPYTALRDGTGAALTIGTAAGDDIDPETGIINSDALKVSYVKETKVDDQAVTFKYDSTEKRLEVEYTATTTDDGTYDASAAAARAEVDYKNAEKFSNSADKWATQADAEYDYVKTLVTETNKLYKAAREAKAAADTLGDASSGAVKGRTEAWDAFANASKTTSATEVLKTTLSGLNSTATAASGSTSINPANTDFLPGNVATAANAMTGSEHTYPQVYQNYTEFVALYNNMFDGANGYVKKIQDALDALDALNDDTTKTPEQMKTAINAQLEIINSNLAKLKADLAAYKLKYADLINQTASDTTVELDTTDATTNGQKAKIQSILDNVNGTVTTNKNSVDSTAATYITKFTDWYNANKTFTEKKNAFGTAITNYNNAVGDDSSGAKQTYDAAVTAGTGAADNHGTTIVPTYSADIADTDGTPKITATAGDYVTYAVTDKTLPTKANYDVELTIDDKTTTVDTDSDGKHSQSVEAWDTLKTTKNQALATAKAAYDDAVAALASGSTIKLYVNLANDYDTYWKIDPADATTDGSQDVDFYLKKILAAGETSHKLIDSITFADTVTANAYKNLTFDLNVGLDSAQITYADDQRTIKSDAVSTWALQPTLANATDLNTTVDWA